MTSPTIEDIEAEIGRLRRAADGWMQHDLYELAGASLREATALESRLVSLKREAGESDGR